MIEQNGFYRRNIKKINKFLSNNMMKNGIYIYFGQMLIVPLNFLFWLIATNIYDDAVVGVISSLISSFSLVAIIIRIGMGNALKRYIPDTEENVHNNLINFSFTLSSIIAIPIIIITLVIIKNLIMVLPEWVFSLESILLLIIYCFGVNFGFFFDSIAISVGKSQYSTLRLGIVSLIKILLILLLLRSSSYGILISFSISGFVISLLFIIILIQKIKPDYKFFFNITKFPKKFFSYSLKHFISQISSNLGLTIMPIIVLSVLNEDNAAYYYIGNFIVMIIYSFSISINQSLLVDSLKNKEALNPNIKIYLKTTFLLVIFAIFFFILFGKYILSLFGENYISVFPYVLIGLISALPYSLNALYYNYLKINERMSLLVYLNVFDTVFKLLGTFIFLKTEGLKIIAILMLLSNVLILIFIVFYEKKKKNSGEMTFGS